MPITKPFSASQFTPTKWDSAEDKAKFANHFVRFVESGFKRTLFPKWFYTRLSMTFGHIAHYDIHGFYNTWFERTVDQLAFLEHTLKHPCYGDPEFTYSDVERAIIDHLLPLGLVTRYRKLVADQIQARELAELARLKAKYPSAASEPVPPSEPTADCTRLDSNGRDCLERGLTPCPPCGAWDKWDQNKRG